MPTSPPDGFPAPDMVRAAYDSADLTRAITCYKHFFPAVSGMAILRGCAAVGLVPNQVFGTMDTRPGQIGLTLNSDTPYAPVILDLAVGPMIIDIPVGAILGAVLNADQSWIADVGIPGPDHGNGGRYLVLPRESEHIEVEGAVTVRASTRHVLAGLRAVPLEGNLDAAIALLRRTRVTPLHTVPGWTEPTWVDMTGCPQDTSPNTVQGTARFWELLRDYLTDEGANAADQVYAAQLAELGITAGTPMPTDDRTLSLLARAAVDADAQMRVQSLSDRRDDRIAWSDRQWEWVSLRPENATFERDGIGDVTARETWFYQAIASSPAMFRRRAGGGSLYWFCAHDNIGSYLDGGTTYSLTLPLPVPAALFWSITVYDARTRSQIDTPQGHAALRSLFELRDHLDHDTVTVHFGPTAPTDPEQPWIQTIPGVGWFVYFRIYGPTEGAFDNSWKPGDFEPASPAGSGGLDRIQPADPAGHRSS
ncbi:DUF1214 domain-containing protein [Nocardia sp. NPDC005978]|uniref:DUF1214 domain-containing protein n=1 Tax=Nocardia sp. NPDC005978 TaxID=3156725 RepID=UPI0033A50A42